MTELQYRTYRPDRDIVPVTPATCKKELMTQDGAHDLARQLDAWWHAKGFPQVHHWVSNKSFRGCYFVRSNLVNGLPPRRATSEIAAQETPEDVV